MIPTMPAKPPIHLSQEQRNIAACAKCPYLFGLRCHLYDLSVERYDGPCSRREFPAVLP